MSTPRRHPRPEQTSQGCAQTLANHVDLDVDDDVDDRHALLRQQLKAALGAVELSASDIDLARMRSHGRSTWRPTGGVDTSSRRTLRWGAAGLVAAAAAAVTVVALGAGPHREAAPTTSSSRPVASGAVFPALGRAQVPADLSGEDGLPRTVQRASVRLLGATDKVLLWAGSTADGRVCFSAVGQYRSSAQCTPGTASTGEPLKVQLDPSLVDARLVPQGYDTGKLQQEGFIQLAPDLWVPATQAPEAFKVFHRLALTQQDGEGIPNAGQIVPDLLPGSERRLGVVDGMTYWVARDTERNVCLIGTDTDTAAAVDTGSATSAQSTCNPAELWAEGAGGFGTEGGRTVELVADGLDASALTAAGDAQVAPNLWLSGHVTGTDG